MERYVVISADTHGGQRVDGYREFVDAEFREAFDEWATAHLAYVDEHCRPIVEKILADDHFDGFGHDDDGTGAEGFWRTIELGLGDATKHVRAMEADGCVGSVVYPGASMDSVPPFTPLTFRAPDTRPPVEASRPHRWAGARAYNRWLAAFCSEFPEQLAGVAVIPDFFDLDEAVAEIEWAAANHLRGGIALPQMSLSSPSFHERYYDPVWAACADTGLPVNVHDGQAADPALYGNGPIAGALSKVESDWFGRRPLWLLMFGGAFDRFPSLQLAFTEQYADWIPAELERLEWLLHTRPPLEPVRATLKGTPREYWRQNCLVGATFMTARESQLRHDTGIETIMWGTDFPHPEGTFPHTEECLRRAFAGIEQDDVTAIVGANAARAYGFDLGALKGIAERVGPLVDDVARPLDEEPADFRRWALRPDEDRR